MRIVTLLTTWIVSQAGSAPARENCEKIKIGDLIV